MRIAENEKPHQPNMPYSFLADPGHQTDTSELLVGAAEKLAGGFRGSPDELWAAARVQIDKRKRETYQAQFREAKETKDREIWDAEHSPKIIGDLIEKETLILAESGGVMRADKIVCPICGKKIDWTQCAENIVRTTSIGDADLIRETYRRELFAGNRNYGGARCADPECPGTYPGGIGTIKFAERL